MSVLVENGCSIEKCTSNDASDVSAYIDKIRAEVKADMEKFDKVSESPKAAASRLIAEAKRDLEDNVDKYGYRYSTTRNALEEAARYINREEYKYAYNELNYCPALSKFFDKYPELMGALAELR